MDMLSTTGLLLGSLTANTVASLSGGGGGLLQLPLLIFLGLPFTVALITHKVAAVALGLGATCEHIRNKTTSWRDIFFVIVSGMAGVMIGSNTILYVPDHVAESVLGSLVLALGFYSITKKSFGQEYNPINRDFKGLLIGGICLTIIGIINGSLTAGTGLFVTLFLVRWFGFDYKQAVALTLISVGVFWNGLGAVTLYKVGAEIYWPWVPALVVGSAVGGYIGARISTRYSTLLIKRAFEMLTIIIGLKLLI